MTGLVPVTDELLVRARNDETLRHALVSAHLERLTRAMGRARKLAGGSDQVTRQVQEGARLAVRLTEILHRLGKASTARSSARAESDQSASYPAAAK
jgi:hypothetical protein